MTADILTKALPSIKAKHFASVLGLSFWRGSVGYKSKWIVILPHMFPFCVFRASWPMIRSNCTDSDLIRYCTYIACSVLWHLSCLIRRLRWVDFVPVVLLYLMTM
jgi:hypothetical protein